MMILQHFSYVKSNVLCKWLNILRKWYVIVFTPENSLLQRSILLWPPGPPPHPTQPANWPCQPSYPASHPTRPATRPCPPPCPASLPSLPAFPACLYDGVALVVRACTILVLLQRPYVWGAAGASPIATPLISYIPNVKSYLPPLNIRCTPSKILCNPSNILCTPSDILPTPSNIVCTPSNFLCTTSNIQRKPYLWWPDWHCSRHAGPSRAVAFSATSGSACLPLQCGAHGQNARRSD